MYIFLTMEKLIEVLNSFGIDITVFTSYEQTVIFLLSNIFIIITNFILIYFVYRIILKMFGWLFG